MKKLIQLSLTLILILSLSSCSSKTNKYVEAAKEYGYLSAFNCSWGMSIDECLNANSLNPEDVELMDDYNESELIECLYFTTENQFLGQDVTVTFIFGTIAQSKHPLGLMKIGIELSEQINFKTGDQKIVEYFEEVGFKSSVGIVNPGGCTYKNQKSLNTLEDKNAAEKAKTFARDVFAKGSPQPFEAGDKPLDLAILTFMLPEDSTPIDYMVTMITLQADGALYLSNSLND